MDSGCEGCVVVTITQPDAPTDLLSVHTGGDVLAALTVLVTAASTLLAARVADDARPAHAGRAFVDILEGVCADLGVPTTRDDAGRMPIVFDLGARTAQMNAPGGMPVGPILPLETWLGYAGQQLKRRVSAAVAARLN